MIDFKVVSAGVGNDPAVKDVKFPNSPTIKSRLLEQLVEQICLPHLEVSVSGAQSPNARRDGNAANIFVMSYPRGSANPSIDIGKVNELNIFDTQTMRCSRKRQLILIGTTQYLSSHRKFCGNTSALAVKPFIDLCCKREIRRERNG